MNLFYALYAKPDRFGLLMTKCRGIRAIFSCKIRNTGNFACEIRNPGLWNPGGQLKLNKTFTRVI